MTAKKKKNFDSERLQRLLETRGCTQDELAKSLRISQGHLSKLINRVVEPGKQLRARIELLSEDIPSGATPWLEAVRRAGIGSPDAKAAIDAILRIMHKNA